MVETTFCVVHTLNSAENNARNVRKNSQISEIGICSIHVFDNKSRVKFSFKFWVNDVPKVEI